MYEQQRHTRERIGGHVAALIEAQGRRKDWVAAQLGISPSHLTRLLSGERPWTSEKLRRVATALQVTVEVLVEGGPVVEQQEPA